MFSYFGIVENMIALVALFLYFPIVALVIFELYRERERRAKYGLSGLSAGQMDQASGSTKIFRKESRRL